MQRSTNHEEPHSQKVHLHRCSCINNSENIMEQGAERFKEPEYQEVGYETVVPRNSGINKTRTIPVSMNMLPSMCKTFVGSHPYKE